MRLNDIIKTMTAYQALQTGIAGRAVDATGRSAQAGAGQQRAAEAQAAVETGLEWLDDEADSVELSGRAARGELAAAETDDAGDDSLGAIIESFTRQRQTYAFTIPGIGGLTSPISVTWEVEQAYRVIEFVPRGQMVDRVA